MKDISRSSQSTWLGIDECLRLFGPLMGGAPDDEEPEDEDDEDVDQLSDPEDLYDEEDDESEDDDEEEEGAGESEEETEDEEDEAATPPTAEADEQGKVKAKSEDATPSAWKPTLPEDLYSKEEKAWMLQAMEDPDPEVRWQVEEFRAQRRIEYNNRAMLVAQGQMASLPQPFVKAYGVVIADYLNSKVPPQKRGTEEALEEAKHWAVYERAKQVGAGKAFLEAARLLGEVPDAKLQAPTSVQKTLKPTQKAQIPPSQKVPASTVSVTPVVSNGAKMNRDERIERGVLSALGLDD